MLKYVLITLAAAVAWGVGLFFELPLWIPIVVSSVAVIAVATILVVKRVRARKAAREIERALKAQADEQARNARPDAEADIRALRGEFDRAIGALKGSRLGARGAASALYALPWYVIVGPPGAGKSTALRNSGLKFPFLSSRGDVSVQGVGGTRNCEWWMTNEAVILDTAGRYATEGADREEWFAFLDLLRTHRSRRPINGVIAAVSIAEVAEAHPEEVASLAREVRARIDELQQRLGVVVPVYVVFTKCDLLPGFVEMFADLSDAEREQIWGFTLAANNQVGVPDRCRDHFDELTAVLEKRALRRLADERGAARRELIHELPQYVASLREDVAAFVRELTERSIHHESPILRGVYLTSGTQEGRPVDRIMGSIAEAFGFQATTGAATSPPEKAKSYFLGGIFRNVIFPDFRLSRLSRARTKRSRIVGNITGALIVLAATALIWLPLISFRHNRTLLTDASTAVAYVEAHVEEDTVDAITVDRLEPLRQLVVMLQSFEDSGEPWEMRMGMYRGERLYPRLRDVYVDTVRRELLIYTMEIELSELRRFVMRHDAGANEVSPEVYAEQFARLRLYLLLTGPAGESQPSLRDAELDFAAATLTQRWERPLRLVGDRGTLTSIEAVARTYLEIAERNSELAFERDAVLVAQVRKILKRADRTRAIADAVVAAVDGKPLTLRSIVRVASIRNDDRVIRPAFTREGYLGVVQPLFAKGVDALLDPQWVIDPELGHVRAQELANVQAEYFRQYIQEWRSFLDSIYLDAPKNTGGLESLVLLSDLTRSKPYTDLFSAVKWHTQLVPEGTVPPEGEAPSELEKQVRRAAGNAATRGAGVVIGRSKAGRAGVTNALVTESAKSLVGVAVESDVEEIRVAVNEHHLANAFAALATFGARPQADEGETAPAPLGEYEEQLTTVRDGLGLWLDDPSEKDAFEKTVKVARVKLNSLLAAQTGKGWSPTLDKLLRPPLDLATAVVRDGTSVTEGATWCNEVVARFERKVGRTYPFDKEAAEETALTDFNAFFAPEKGALWVYWKHALSTTLPMRGDHFEQASVGPTRHKFRASVVNFLNAANEVTQTVFPNGAPDPKVEFEVSIAGAPGVSEIKLVVDGQKIRYHNGPEVWATMTWPGKGTSGAKISAHGHNVRTDLERRGDWGLFRLFEEGRVKQVPGGRVFIVQWDFRDEGAGLIQIRVRPKSADAPFFGFEGQRGFMSIFRTRHLAAPRSLVPGARPCAKR